MTIELIGIFGLVVGLSSFYFGAPFIVYALVCASILGSAAAFILEAIGGTNISPAHLLLGFLAAKLAFDRNSRRQMIRSIIPPEPGFWLALTVTYAVISAYVLPRVFAGKTFVIVVRAVDSFSFPLAPVMANLTQSIYLVADFLCFVLIYAFATEPAGRRTVRNALIACTVLNLIFAGLDLLTYATGTTELLSFIRNANYSLISEAELVGMKRIVGSFIEASAFGAATLGYFTYTATLWLSGVRTRLMFVLSCASLLALIFSTSSTAYVGLAAIFMLGYFAVLLAIVRGKSTPQMIVFAVATPLFSSALAAIICLNDDLATPIGNVLSETLFNKLSTASGAERASWNSQALQVFVDTFGFGAGNGSMRTSSFPLAVLANLGIIGSVLFGLFFVSLFLAGTRRIVFNQLENAHKRAATWVCGAWLITATTSGALTDLGLSFFVFAAMACSFPDGSCNLAFRGGNVRKS